MGNGGAGVIDSDKFVLSGEQVGKARSAVVEYAKEQRKYRAALL